MVKKKIDSRIRTVIENGVAERHRSMFVIIGDRGRDQVVNLHYILSKARVRARPNVLWCYKKELGFTSNRVKRASKLKRDISRGIRQADEENPFELFVGATDIRYTYYKETDKVLGQTFGMCVLQDFASLTPNILARTLETVEGGGVIVLLVKTIDSLRQLYTMSMDVHSRYRTEAHNDVVGRFNERFMLSLSYCQNCLVVDDELNILPISSHVRDIQKISYNTDDFGRPVIVENDHVLSEKEIELKELKSSLRDTQPIGSLIDLARTLDQAKGVLTFAEAISEKSLKATVALLASRGRGKSAALGISIACAIAYGYSNVFVTAPSPENLKTLFEMILTGFTALGYKDHIDYEVVESTNPAMNHAIVRVNVFRNHRQTIQYIAPHEHQRLSQAELLVIDEAAAIPLPMVQRLIGPYLVFIASTVNGYEGTGRSLSLKLIKQLREQSALAHHSALSSQNKNSQQVAATQTAAAAAAAASASSNVAANLRGRTLREVTLEEPIRYAENDPVEKWLNQLLCLDCTNQVPKLTRSVGGGGVPHPSLCQLYYVDRDTLFSHHKASEAFLQRMMSLYVSSHYKNSPNDLQLMSDAPAHHLFVLLGPVKESTALPDILCVIQVCLEGEITSSNFIRQTSRGINPSGDLIPWCVSQQFQNSEFAGLSGARVVRIAVHPELQKMGYGSRALELLIDYYEEKFTSIDEMEDTLVSPTSTSEFIVKEGEVVATGDSKLLTEIVAPRKHLPPLLSQLSDRRPEPLHWLGVSFGLTKELFNFWQRQKFVPLYVRQSVNEVTGEHTCVMVRAQNNTAASAIAAAKGIAHSGILGTEGEDKAIWLESFGSDFRKRFTQLLGFDFRRMHSSLALSVLMDAVDRTVEGVSPTQKLVSPLTAKELSFLFTEYDLKRLESYSKNLVDYHMILDLLPTLARLYFLGRFDVSLSYIQGALIMGMGLQMKSLTDIEVELNTGATQLLAIFNKCIRKLSTYLRSVEENSITSEMTAKSLGSSNQRAVDFADSGIEASSAGVNLNVSLASELADSGKEVQKQLKLKQDALLSSLSLDEYAIAGTDEDWAKTENAFTKSSTGTVSVKSSKDKQQLRAAIREAGMATSTAKKTQKRSGGSGDRPAKKSRQ